MSEQGSLRLVVEESPITSEVIPLHRNPEFTGVRYRAQHPDHADSIVRMYREGASRQACAEAFGCAWSTVDALIRAAESGASVEEHKKRSAAEYRHLAGLCREAAREVLLDPMRSRKVAFRDMVIGAGVFEDKAALVSGDIPFMFVPVTEPLSVEDFERRIDAAREARRMGLGRETSGQKELPATAGSLQPAGPAAAGPAPAHLDAAGPAAGEGSEPGKEESDAHSSD